MRSSEAVDLYRNGCYVTTMARSTLARKFDTTVKYIGECIKKQKLFRCMYQIVEVGDVPSGIELYQVYDLNDNEVFITEGKVKEIAKWFNVSDDTVLRALSTNNILKDRYLVVSTENELPEYSNRGYK